MLNTYSFHWGPLLRARSLRAFIELIGFQLILLFLSLLPAFSSTKNIPRYSAYTIFLCVIYCFLSLNWLALRWRLRPPARTIWQQLLVEIEIAGVFGLEVFCSLFTFSWFMHPNNIFFLSFERIGWLNTSIAIVLCSCIGLFLVRVGLHLLCFWNQLRQTRLRWEVTHSHLMVVVIGAGVISALFVVSQVILGAVKLFTEAAPIFNTLFFLLVMFVVTVFVIACVLPPSILSSYIFTRRITRRVEKLALATSILRSGDYSIRVRVEGQDEIARLQADFNAMAAELERAMRELKEERDNVATLLNARRELIASVSHELRTPVATVRSYLESALTNWQVDQPPITLKQDMQIIEQQTIRLQSLINDLFMLARAEVGHLEMRCEPTNVDFLVARVVETIAPIAWRGSRVEVLSEKILLAPEFPLALVDCNRMEQILHNLIHNGIRHTPPGGIIAVVLNADEKAIILQVKDTGEGIAAGELAKIWDRFYRASNTQSQQGSGTGLGLAIVKELTEAMGGKVAVESIVNQGTCFTIHIPLVQKNDHICATPALDTIERVRTSPLAPQ